MRKHLLISVLLSVIFPGTILSQGYLSWGLATGKEYDVSQFDSVDPQTHKLVVHIPIYTLTQKGSLPPIAISLVENSPSYDYLDASVGLGQLSISQDMYGGSPGLVPASVSAPSFRSLAVPYQDPNTDYWYAYTVHYIRDYTGALHPIHPLVADMNHWVAIDGSGYGGNLGTNTFYDSAGNHFTSQAIADIHGNTIGLQSASLYSDSLGRAVPNPSIDSPAVIGATASSPGCITYQMPSYQGTSPFTFCYKVISVQSSLPVTSSSLLQTVGSLATLASVSTPGGTYSFDYDSWGDVTKIGLPTGGSISYEYATRYNSQYINDYTQGVYRAVSKRTLSTGSDTSTGQTSVTQYSFDDSLNSEYGFITTSLARTIYPDSSYSVLLVKGEDPSHDSFTTYFYNSDGTMLKKVFDSSLDQILVGGQVKTTTWSSGRVDKATTTFFTAASTAGPQWCDENEFIATSTPTNQNFTHQAFQLLLPVEVDEFQTGWNASVGSLARRTITHYAFESQSPYVSAHLWNPVSSISTLDGTGNSVSSTYFSYDESTYSPYGVQGNLTSQQGGGVTTHKSYFSDGIVSSIIDGRNNSTVVDRQCNNALPKTVKNALNQQAVYSYDCDSGLLSAITDSNTKTTSYLYDALGNLTKTSYPDNGVVQVDYHNYAHPLQVTTTRTAQPDPNIVTTKSYDGLGAGDGKHCIWRRIRSHFVRFFGACLSGFTPLHGCSRTC